MGCFNPISYFIKSFIRLFTRKFFWVILILILFIFCYFLFNIPVNAYSNNYEILDYISCTPWVENRPSTQESYFIANINFKSNYRVVMKYKIGTLNVQYQNLSLFGSLDSNNRGNYLNYFHGSFYTQDGSTNLSATDGEMLYIDYNNNGKVYINGTDLGNVTCINDTNPFYINYRYFDLSYYNSFPFNRRILLLIYI